MVTKKLSCRGRSIVKELLKNHQSWTIYGNEVRDEASKLYWEKRGEKWQGEKSAPGCSKSTWEKFLAAKNPIRPETFDLYCEVLGLDPAEVIYVPKTPKTLKTDWGQAPDLETFYGRGQELADFKKLIIENRCRLISIVGFAGTGKTKLSLKLAHQVKEEFEYIIWRKLYGTLPLEHINSPHSQSSALPGLG